MRANVQSSMCAGRIPPLTTATRLLAIAVVTVAAIALVALVAPSARAHPPSVPRLAFIDGHTLRVVGADGHDERTLDATGEPAGPLVWDWLRDPSWSPDGTKVAYAQADGASWVAARTELRIAPVDGSKGHTVLALPGAGIIETVRWSPDGRRLAFVLLTQNPAAVVTWGAVGNRWDIYVINVDGSGLRPVAPAHPIDASRLDWSPDGTKLAFESDAGGVPGIYTVAVDGLPLLARVSPPHIVSTHPRWAPDGASIAFIGTPVLPVTGLLNESPQLWIADADGSDARGLPARTYSPPTWSPDGRWLAYSCIEGGCGINVIRTDGRAGRTLTGAPRIWDDSPIWSRHGQIAFIRGSQQSGRTLWVMNGDGSDQRQLTDASYVVFDVSWSK